MLEKNTSKFKIGDKVYSKNEIISTIKYNNEMKELGSPFGRNISRWEVIEIIEEENIGGGLMFFYKLKAEDGHGVPSLCQEYKLCLKIEEA